MKRNKVKDNRTCDTCKKQHTMLCPNSYHCYSRDDKPYWEQKEKGASEQ
jgi:hypothetical protein